VTTRIRFCSFKESEMDIKTLERRQRESVASAASASSNEARIAHEGLAQGYADRLHEQQEASAAPLQVTAIDEKVHIAVPGQPDAVLTPQAASETADGLLSGARVAERQSPRDELEGSKNP
jgi:hypothetical protein